ncbi:hypothetical protein [Aquidulcibacter sp.]|uniref:calcium-binding protein n=1 Tax=Aquidulcibacter sp. TaxID=2052990 RepID=UPI003BA816DC
MAYNIGQSIEISRAVAAYNANPPPDGSAITQNVTATVFSNFGIEFAQFTAGAAIGSISSYMSMELGKALGLRGFGAELFSTVSSTLLSHALTNVASNLPILKNLVAKPEVWFGDNAVPGAASLAFASSIGSYFGQKLAMKVVTPNTQAGATLSSLYASYRATQGAQIGFQIGYSLGGPIGGFIGAVLGATLASFTAWVHSTNIFNLFGKKKQRVPSAFADAVLSVQSNRFEIGTSSVSSGGNLELARNMATVTQETLNGLIETIAAGQKLRSIWSGSQGALTARFGHTNDQLWVRLGGQYGPQTNVNSADEAVDKAVLWSLPNLQIAGGNMFLKRAVARSKANSVTTLTGDMQIAEDYGFYLQNRALIDAAIAEPYTSMKLATTDYLAWMRSAPWDMDLYKSQAANGDPEAKDLAKMRAWAERRLVEYGSAGTWVHSAYAVAANVDSNFYDANKSFMTRALAKDSVPLNGGDLAFYNANKVQVDRIISRLALTQFAASWIITLQRAAELKINQASASDFFGGAQGFADSLKLMSSAGDSPSFYDDLRLTMQPDGTTLRAEYLSGGSNRVRGADLSRGDDFVHTWWAGGGASSRGTQTVDGERAFVINGSGVYQSWGNTDSGVFAINGGDRADGWYSVRGGERLGFGLEFKSGSSNSSIVAHVHFWAADGTELGYQTGAQNSGYSADWQKVSGVVTAPANAAYAAVVVWTFRGGNFQGQQHTTALRRFQVETLAAGATGVSDWAGSSYDTFDLGNFWNDVGYNNAGSTFQISSNRWGVNPQTAGASNQFYDYSNWSADLEIKDWHQQVDWVEDPPYYDYWGNWVNAGSGSYQTVTYTGGDDVFKSGSGNDRLEGWGGNDWLDGGSGRDGILGGEGDDVLLGRAGIDGLVGGEGNDYLSLGDGDDYTDWVLPINGGAWGEGGDDVFSGGQGQDSMFGGEGNDLFIADEDSSWDWYDGGNGSDTVSYVKFSSAINYDLSVRAGWGWGPEARAFMGDGLNLIENITGTNFNDVIRGDEVANILKGGFGDDQLYGKAGNDTFEGGQGADKFFGEDGSDTASYENSQAAVWVSLHPTAENNWAGEGFGGDAEGDTYSWVENLTGSAFADTLKGEGGYNNLIGGRGDDWFTATSGGDRHEGGEGFDTVDFSELTSASWVDLNAGYGQWAAGGTTYVGIEHLFGSNFGDQFFGSARDETFSGGKGNDYLSGGGGSDTYVFNIGDGYDTLADDASASNALIFGEGVTWSKLSFNAPGQGLQMMIRGTGEGIWLDSNFSSQSGNNKIKTIDVGGAGSLEIGRINHGRSGNAWGEYIFGNTNTFDWNWGYEGDDIIYGSGNNGWYNAYAAYEQADNIIVGGEGNDTIYTSVGDDTFVFERGHGTDTINDGGGRDRIVIGSTATMEDVIYKVDGYDLWVGLKDQTNSALEANQVADKIKIVNGGIKYRDMEWGSPNGNMWNSSTLVEHVAAGGAEIDFTKLDVNWTIVDNDVSNYNWWYPVVLDLGDDGADLVSVEGSQIVFKPDNNAPMYQMGWVDGDDGILALDRDGDGAITKMSEISFVKDFGGAKTDMEGLRGFDTNKDGVLDANDERFAEFKVWRDVNQNGRGRGKELQTLAQVGITSINLSLTSTGFSTKDTRDNVILNTANFTWADGTTGTANDVALGARLAHVAGPVLGKGSKASVKPSDDGELGRAKSSGKNKLDKVTIANGAEAPKQNLEFVRADANDGSANLKKVVKKKRTFKDRDAAAGTATPSAGTAAPLVIDLDGDGIELVEAADSKVWFDLNEDGFEDRLGWAGSREGILALDRDGDGLVQPLSEISFVQDLPGAMTDLEGLKAFDTNGDDWLTSADATFSSFLIWTDTDQNGQSSYEELVTLDQAGIEKIGLVYIDHPMRKQSQASGTELATTDLPSYQMAMEAEGIAEATSASSAQVGEGVQTELAPHTLAPVKEAATSATENVGGIENTKNRIFGHAEVVFKDGRIVRAADAAFGTINGLAIDPLASASKIAETASTNPYEALDFGQPWSLNAGDRRKMIESLRDQSGPPKGFDDLMSDDGTFNEAGSNGSATSFSDANGSSSLEDGGIGHDALPGSLASIAPASDVFAAITSARSLSGLEDRLADNAFGSSDQENTATNRAIKRWWTDPAAGIQAFRSTLAGKDEFASDLAAMAESAASSQASGALMSSADAASARQNQAFAQAITQFKSPARMGGTNNRTSQDGQSATLAPGHVSGIGLSKARTIATNWA